MNPAQLLAHFDRISDAPDAIPRLRRFILDLAVRGKLVEQDPRDEPAAQLLKRIQSEKERLILKGEYRRQKPLPDVHDEDAPFRCPNSWRWARLGMVTYGTQGFAFPSERFSNAKEDGPPLIKIGDIGSNNPTVFVRGDYDSSYLVHDGDLLLGLSGSIKCAIWEGPLALLNQRIARIAPVPNGLNPQWLVFGVEKCIEIWISETSKLTVQNVKTGQLFEAVVPVPPLAEQHRIVAKVDELMALCDRLEAAQAEREIRRDRLVTSSLTRLNNGAEPDAFHDHASFYFNHLPRLTTKPEYIQQLRQTILNLAVRGKLVPQDPQDEPASELLRRIQAERMRLLKAGILTQQKLTSSESMELAFAIPMTWQAVNFNDVCNLVTSGSRGWAEFYSETGPKFIRAQNIRFGRLRLEDLACVSLPKKAEGTRTQVSKGDLLIVITGAGVTNPAMLDHELGEAYVSQDVALIKPTVTSLSRWLLLCLMAPTGARAELVRRAYGAGKPGLNLDNIRSLRIAIPPLAEQQRIVAKVDELMALCDKLEAQLTTTHTDSRHLLEAVLHEALAPAV